MKEIVMSATVSILPIINANFYLFFIAFVVVFFLLGFIIGYILNPRRKLRKIKEKPLAEIINDTPDNSKDLGQDIPVNEETSIQNPITGPGRYNNYNNYWGYIKPPKQY